MEPTAFDWWSLGISASGSIATIVALGVAVWLGLRESHAVRAENARRDDERREAEERRRRAQAECISAEVSVANYSMRRTQDDQDEGPRRYHPASVTIRNASALAIYDVHTYASPSEPDETARRGVRFIPGGESRRFALNPEPHEHLHGEPVHLWFRDASGTPWYRHSGGNLEELPGSSWSVYQSAPFATD